MKKYMENAHLDGREFNLIENHPTCVILTHGFTATTVEVQPFAHQIFKAGYDVIAPLLPGHNTDPFDLNKQKYTDWIDTVEQKLTWATERYERVFVAGESMGGLLSCYLAENHSHIAGVLLFAPALSVKNLFLLGLLRYLKPYIGQVAEEAEEETEDEYIHPWKGYKVKPTWAGYELYRLQKIVRADLAKIKQPILIFQGLHDETIEVKSSQIIFEQVSSPLKKLILLENSAHCIILDKELDDVVEKSLQFLENPAAAVDHHGNSHETNER